jgi:hypothetical protein
MLKNVDNRPLENIDNDPPCKVPELEIREHPPLTLKNIDGGPLGGTGAGDPRASTLNARNRRRWTPLGGDGAKDSRVATINARNVDGAP